MTEPKLVSVVTPCYNEAGNVRELRDAIRGQFAAMPQYRYEHIYIDNASTDRTVAILREMAAADSNVKVILNTRNFGHIRSPHHAVLQAQGDVVICMASDFQDPPGLIPEFIRSWEEGFKIVLGVKATVDERPVMNAVRKAYYQLLTKLAEIRIIENATGFGLYDRDVVQVLRRIDDPYPYTRGLLADIGYETATISFHKPSRRRGITKNNLYTLYDMAMLGITNHSRVPLRLATMLGFLMSGISFLLALIYLALKLLFWYRYPAGIAPVLIGVLFFSSVQLFFTGILGEYIGAILTQAQKRPLVFEKERINFPGAPTTAMELAPLSLTEVS
jgi:polyisoprenyl-phosphate glycosyltransferase